MTSLKKQAGITLIEVLITFLILAVGLLGVAGLQTVGMRNNHNALLRSHASFLAYELADFMRINKNGVVAGNYNIPAQSTVPGFATDCAAGTCTTAEVAAFNLNRWFTNLLAALPNASARIDCTNIAGGAFTCSPGSLIEITINWNESTTAGSATTSFMTEVEL